jgi:UDP-glucose 4-epimerase
MHLATFIQVGESKQQSAEYHQNNVVNTLNLLEAMRAHGVQKFIFSYTADTFSEQQYTPIDEQHPQQPINPYGRTKQMIVQALTDKYAANGMKSICLCCFNAAGADTEGQLGERHVPETHLIPLMLQTASGHRPHISVFGRDYDTPDDTAIRDYVHIADLCEANWLALQSLINGGPSQAYNLGNGNGFSVQEVIDTAEAVTGRNITVVNAPRREGDHARLVADATICP